jgi:L-lysine exporter family protein LysE/ArgO
MNWSTEPGAPSVEVVPFPSALMTAAAGLALGLSLIVALGAQNAFVLRQGLRREHVAAVATVCAVSDAVLVAVGVMGAGAALDAVPWLLAAIRIAGAVFLLGYGLLAARRALRPHGVLDAGHGEIANGLAATVGVCLALTWFNPHVYLDTVVLLGGIANTHGDRRWWFAAGAAAGSALWFTGLAYGARFLQPLFARRVAWRVLDAVIAAVMVTLAAGLASGAI